jgi:glycosyltransferase involved in cell wall biosynthesis
MIQVSVSIPTYNRPGFLRRALRSVQAQTLAPFEIVVLDNASEDAAWRELPELNDPRVRTICHPSNIGVVANWNAAIGEARGDAVCMLHDDDVMHPRYLEVMAGLLETHPGIGMAFCQARRVDCMGTPLGIWWKTAHDGVIAGADYVLWSLQRSGTLALPSAVTYRLSACRAVGEFGGGLTTTAFDHDYIVRIAKQFDIGFTAEVLSDYTLHPHQISEQVWRRNRTAGLADASLETLNAGCWLLGQPTLADDTRRDVAQILSKATTVLARYVRQRTPRSASRDAS